MLASKPGRRLRETGWAILAALMVTQCVCQNNRPETTIEVAPVKDPPATRAAGKTETKGGDATPLPPLPTTIDTKDLDADEKRTLTELLSEQYDPCGKPRSFLEALGDASACPMAKKLAELAITKISQGLSKRQVSQALLQEQARWASKADFELDGVPFVGEPGPGKRVLVEFSDFQCPHCKLAVKPVHDLAHKYGAVLYSKQLPLDFHPVAKEASFAALACHGTGKYWPMFEALFENQDRLSSAVIRELAAKVGCDMGKLEDAMKSDAVVKAFERDMGEAHKFKIDGTPTFFLDGYQVEFEQLEEALKAPPRE